LPDIRDLPDQPSLRHLKLEAKRRLAGGEFTILHEAQLAIAREHGFSSWTVLKEHITAAESANSHALTQVRRLFNRFQHADTPEWIAPDHGELSGHLAEHLLTDAPPATMARLLGSVSAQLRQDLAVVEVGRLHLRANVGDLRVEAVAEPEPPHRLTRLRVYPGGVRVTDSRVAQPPVESVGPVPDRVSGIIEDTFTDLGLVGLIAAGDWDAGPVLATWAHARGWADLERGIPCHPDHRFPARALTKLITSTAVLCLVAEGRVGLDEPVNSKLHSLRLEDDAVTVRELLAHTGGVVNPESMWAGSVVEAAEVLGPVVGCPGSRGEFAYGEVGYAVLGQLLADLTGESYATAATRLVLGPLGMSDSWFPTEAPEPSPDVVVGYRLADDGAFYAKPLPMFKLQASGGLWSTAEDLVRFGSSWQTLLPAELAAEALRPQAVRDASMGTEMGLGWLLLHRKDTVGHAGGSPGATISLLMRPSTGRTGVVLSNRLISIEPVNARLMQPVG